ncbi:MAG TPA: MerR family transcriptional regulator [Humibacter sp.]|nr:MerR family transcriptional regulator [Humibacter sp.]
MTGYSPAETVERSGFSIETLRYYERIGLLTDIDRDTAGRRLFSEDDLQWLEVLRCLRETGMPIATMQRYAELALEHGPESEASIAELLQILREHDQAVAAKIERLQAQQRHLHEKIAHYAERAAAVPAR